MQKETLIFKGMPKSAMIFGSVLAFSILGREFILHFVFDAPSVDILDRVQFGLAVISICFIIAFILDYRKRVVVEINAASIAIRKGKQKIAGSLSDVLIHAKQFKSIGRELTFVDTTGKRISITHREVKQFDQLWNELQRQNDDLSVTIFEADKRKQLFWLDTLALSIAIVLYTIAPPREISNHGYLNLSLITVICGMAFILFLFASYKGGKGKSGSIEFSHDRIWVNNETNWHSSISDLEIKEVVHATRKYKGEAERWLSFTPPADKDEPKTSNQSARKEYYVYKSKFDEYDELVQYLKGQKLLAAEPQIIGQIVA